MSNAAPHAGERRPWRLFGDVAYNGLRELGGDVRCGLTVLGASLCASNVVAAFLRGEKM
jgi:hypothetical protein